MDTEQFLQILEDKNDEYLKYDRIEKMRHERVDIAALMLLHEIAGGSYKVIEGADHDVVYLTDICTLCEKGITEAQIIELIRLGIGEHDGEYLSMNV